MYNTIWKQFTTTPVILTPVIELCLTNVQYNLKAIHNGAVFGTLITSVVFDQCTIQSESNSQHNRYLSNLVIGCVWPMYNTIWKQFTTMYTGFMKSKLLCLTNVQYNLKAIHNIAGIVSTLFLVVFDQCTIQSESNSQLAASAAIAAAGCVWPMYNTIWKQFTTLQQWRIQ